MVENQSNYEAEPISGVTSGQVAVEPITKSSDDHANIGELAAN